jgi:hypothetical protein
LLKGVGNEVFASFASTESKSRVSLLPLLRAPHTDYRIREEALEHMRQQALPQRPLQCLRCHEPQNFPEPAQWTQHLTDLGITQERHRRIATEGALLGSVLDHGVSPGLAIVSEDAGPFNILLPDLCWVHAERLVHKLPPSTRTIARTSPGYAIQSGHFMQTSRHTKPIPPPNPEKHIPCASSMHPRPAISLKCAPPGGSCASIGNNSFCSLYGKSSACSPPRCTYSPLPSQNWLHVCSTGLHTFSGRC